MNPSDRRAAKPPLNAAQQRLLYQAMSSAITARQTSGQPLTAAPGNRQPTPAPNAAARPAPAKPVARPINPPQPTPAKPAHPVSPARPTPVKPVARPVATTPVPPRSATPKPIPPHQATPKPAQAINRSTRPTSVAHVAHQQPIKSSASRPQHAPSAPPQSASLRPAYTDRKPSVKHDCSEGAPDHTLLQRIGQYKTAIILLFAINVAVTVLCLGRQVHELQLIKLSPLYILIPLFLHYVAIGIHYAYITSAEHNLCLFRTSEATRQSSFTARLQRYKRDRAFIVAILVICVGILIPTRLALSTLAHHYRQYFFGLVIFRAALIAAVIQLTLVLTMTYDIRDSLKEWRELRQDFPHLDFARYAHDFDDYFASIAD